MDFNFVKFSIAIDGRKIRIINAEALNNARRDFLLSYQNIAAEVMLELLVDKSLRKSRNYPNQQLSLKAPFFYKRKSMNIPEEYQDMRKWRENIEGELNDLLTLAQNDPSLKKKKGIQKKIEFCIDKISELKSSDDFTRFFAHYRLPLEK